MTIEAREKSRSISKPSAFDRADAFFLPDTVRQRSANELAYARIGVIGCFAVGLSDIAFIPWQVIHWPWPILLGMLVSGVICLSLPFLLRQRDAIRHLGHFVCAQVTCYSLAVLLMSGGRATGILPVLPMIPMLALLMRGGRAVVGWSLVTAGVALLGMGLASAGAPSRVADFRELQNIERYPITLICLLGMLGITLLFERLWSRSALELAERAQTDLARREDRYRTLLEHASEGILVVDRTGQIQFASPAAEKLIGLAPGGAVGLPIASLTDEAGVAEAMIVWRDAMAKPGEAVRAELRSGLHVQPGGPDVRRLELSVTNHLDHPAVQGVVVHLHDVTALARAKTNYQNLVERSLQGVVLVREFRIVFANQALADLFGAPLDRIVGLHVDEILEFVHPDDRARVVTALGKPAADAADAVMEPLELRIVRPRGPIGWAQIRWADAVSDGLTARQITYIDITAQKELEASRQLEQERLEARIAERTRELEASQQTLRAQERLAAVGTLAAGVAHQINNPVGAILAAAEYAIVAADESDHVLVTRSALQEIKAQAVRCGRIIRSILQFSRAEATEKWSGDLISVLRTAVDATRRLARERDTKVALELDKALASASVLMSPIELEQVFVNLILNAIQAQGPGAQVWITARLVGHEVEIRVEDDGPGVAATDRDRIFDPFFTTRLKGGGTGLGLSVAHGIIADHGGRMELVDPPPRPGTGACFLVSLPVEKPAAGIPAQTRR